MIYVRNRCPLDWHFVTAIFIEIQKIAGMFSGHQDTRGPVGPAGLISRPRRRCFQFYIVSRQIWIRDLQLYNMMVGGGAQGQGLHQD